MLGVYFTSTRGLWGMGTQGFRNGRLGSPLQRFGLTACNNTFEFEV